MKLNNMRNTFFKKLDSKTGWGKEQVKAAFDETAFELLDEEVI